MLKKEVRILPGADNSPKSKARRSAHIKQQRMELRRRQIFAAALYCFQEKGYHSTTLNDIARVAAISSGLIYQYFSDKQDLLFQVILEILESYNREIPKALTGKRHPLERLTSAASAYFNVIEADKAATLLAYRETKLLDRSQISLLMLKEEQTNRLITSVLEECVDNGFVKPDKQELNTYVILNMSHMWALKNWRLRKYATPEEYLGRTMEMLLSFILTDAGKEEARVLGIWHPYAG